MKCALKRNVFKKKGKKKNPCKNIGDGNILETQSSRFFAVPIYCGRRSVCDTLLETMARIFKCVARVPDVVPESKRNVSHGDVELRRVPRLPSVPPSFRFVLKHSEKDNRV